MPYRRLPNTDAARIRALKTAIEKKKNSSDYNVFIINLSKAEMMLRKFENAQTHYLKDLEIQVEASKRYQKLLKEAKLYVSHFIQVLNMCIIRGEMKASVKKMYGLSTDTLNVPDINTIEILLDVGDKLIEGEQKRLVGGGIPIYNPSIARVKVAYSMFKDAHTAQKIYQQNTNRHLSELAQQRQDMDDLIKELWNQIEESFSSLSAEQKLKECREYGIIYYYRKGEKDQQD